MRFYQNRTVDEQKERLPLEFQRHYQATQLDRIEIDGEVIQGYFEYSFMEEKSYVEQPTRAIDGTIENIDDIATFLTPRLIIKYNMMNIEDYRKLMRLLKYKNSFKVTCYDIVEDERVTHEMYFAPPQMPIIYQQYLKALGIQDYTIELIGTNVDSKYRVFIYYNLPDDVTSNQDFQRFTLHKGEPFLTNIVIDGNETNTVTGTSNIYTIKEFNTKPDGSGNSLATNFRYYFENNIVLYAQWQKV